MVFTYALSWMDRKVTAIMQGGHGPAKTGAYGFFQNLADFIKLFSKEDFVPDTTYKFLFQASLLLMLSASLFLVLVVPVFPELSSANLSLGLLVVFAILSFIPVLTFVNGFASGNKFAGMGVQQAILTLACYEVPALIAIASVGMMANSYSLLTIVQAQAHSWFVVLMPLGFVVLLVAIVAELRSRRSTPRNPDELLSGWSTRHQRAEVRDSGLHELHQGLPRQHADRDNSSLEDGADLCCRRAHGFLPRASLSRLP